MRITWINMLILLKSASETINSATRVLATVVVNDYYHFYLLFVWLFDYFTIWLFYSLLAFYYKAYNSGTTKGKKCIRQGMWEMVWSFHTPPGTQPSQHIVMFIRASLVDQWVSGKESTCHCRKHEFNPCSRKIPHAEEQLSLCSTIVAPVL